MMEEPIDLPTCISRSSDTAEYEGDASSLTSITSLTMTASGQVSQRSVLKHDDIQHDDDQNINHKQQEENQHEETFSTFIDKMKKTFEMKLKEFYEQESIDLPVVSETIDEFINGISKAFEAQLYTANSNTDEVRKDLANVLKELQETKVMLAHNTKGEQTLRDANDTLNHYIDQAEEYYAKELGTLKAKLSLNRIENTVSLEVEKQAAQADLSTVTTNTPQKRKRSLKFWKRNSTQQQRSVSLPHNCMDVIPKNIVEDSVKHELEEKCIKIEELRGIKEDLEKRNELLETTLVNRNLEISTKRKRIEELKEQVSKVKENGDRSCDIIHEIHNVLSVLCQEVTYLEDECKTHRQTVKHHRELLENLEWHIFGLSEENKIVLSRVNKKSYELNIEKLKTEAFVQDMKTFLTSFLIKVSTSMSKSTIEKEFKKHGLSKLIQLAHASIGSKEVILDLAPKISKTKEQMTAPKILLDNKAVQTQTTKDLKRERSSVQRDSKSIQTSHFIKMEEKSSQCLKPEFNLKSTPEDILKDSVEHGSNADSGVELRSKNSITNEIFKNPNMDGSNKEFFEETLAYVEHMKNKEIDSCRKDLSVVTQENSNLRRMYHEIRQQIETDQKQKNIETITMQHQQKESTPKLRSPKLNIADNRDTSNEFSEMNDSMRRNQLFDEFRQMKNSRRQLNYSPLKLDSLNMPVQNSPINMNTPYNSPSLNVDHVFSNHTVPNFSECSLEEPDPNNCAFLQSFEIGNSLIRDIFDEKDQLEHELVQSREVRGRRKEFLNIR